MQASDAVLEAASEVGLLGHSDCGEAVNDVLVRADQLRLAASSAVAGEEGHVLAPLRAVIVHAGGGSVRPRPQEDDVLLVLQGILPPAAGAPMHWWWWSAAGGRNGHAVQWRRRGSSDTSQVSSDTW
ncbi:Os01g0624266 [Oryza sativa Japonica Group]|nr:Os01g0624266 [Oryza sativa Japonica Group]